MFKKKISIIFALILILTSCKSAETNNARFNSPNKKNYNDIQSALKDDPINAGTDKQNPNDYKIQRHKGAVASKDEYVLPESQKKDKITKEELDEKRDEDSKDGIINISDGIFLPLVNDIYINKDEYIGKKVRLSGQHVQFEDPDTDEVVHAILREGPGCCYNDSVIGFEFITDGEYPESQKWYEMVGEVILDNYGTGKVVKLKAIQYKEIEPKTDKLIHFGN